MGGLAGVGRAHIQSESNFRSQRRPEEQRQATMSSTNSLQGEGRGVWQGAVLNQEYEFKWAHPTHKERRQHNCAPLVAAMDGTT